MVARKNNEPASWEVDAHLLAPVGETRVRRSYAVKELIMRPAQGVDTVFDVISFAAQRHGDRPCFGNREVLEIVKVDESAPPSPGSKRPKLARRASLVDVSRSTGGKMSSSPSLRDGIRTAPTGRLVDKYRLAPFDWMSYSDALQEARIIGSGLRQLEHGRDSRNSFFGIYHGTSRNWMLVALACAFNGIPISTVIDVINRDGLASQLRNSDSYAVFTSTELLHKLEAVLPSTPNVRLIIYDGKPMQQSVFPKFPRVRLVHLNEVRLLGLQHPQVPRNVQRDDVFAICHTSGSTIDPKPVVLTHGNIVAQGKFGIIVASTFHLEDNVFAEQEVYLAFLPLAHIFEMIFEFVNIWAGLPIAYGRAKTLTNAGVIDCEGDIAAAKPTMMIAVPQVWESIRKNILYKVSRAGGLKRTVFNVAVKAKAAAQSRGLTGIVSLTDSIVFNAVRAGTGGRLHTLVSGGSHLSASTQRFLSTTLVQMVLGMCLSEATALAFVMNPAWKTVEAVGGPVPAIEAKLVDRPEEGLRYLSTDSPPRGEIYVRGPALFKGYYKRPDLDSERFAPGGWFKTGDIGQWNPDGTLTLIDRIENHVWVGDRIAALGRVEAVYKGATFVENGMVMVRNNRLAMVVVAHKDGLPALAQKHRIRPGSLYDLCNNPRVINACLKELNLAARREGLKRHELLKALIIVTDEWSPESGLLTAGHKLRRATIAEHYREAFDRATGETVTLGTGFLPEDEDDTVDPPTLTPSGSSFATSNDVVSLSSSRDHWATPHYSLDFNHEDIPAFKRGIAR